MMCGAQILISMTTKLFSGCAETTINITPPKESKGRILVFDCGDTSDHHERSEILIFVSLVGELCGDVALVADIGFCPFFGVDSRSVRTNDFVGMRKIHIGCFLGKEEVEVDLEAAPARPGLQDRRGLRGHQDRQAHQVLSPHPC